MTFLKLGTMLLHAADKGVALSVVALSRGDWGGITGWRLSPPQRLLLVNSRERNGSGSAGDDGKREKFPARSNFPSSQPPRAANAFFPRRDCRKALRRRELFVRGRYLSYGP